MPTAARQSAWSTSRYLWALLVALVVATVVGYGIFTAWWPRMNATAASKKWTSAAPGEQEFQRFQRFLAGKSKAQEADITGNVAHGNPNVGGVQGNQIPGKGKGVAFPLNDPIQVKQNAGAAAAPKRNTIVGGGPPVSPIESLFSGNAFKHYEIPRAVPVGRKPVCQAPDRGSVSLDPDLETVPTEKELLSKYKDVGTGGRWHPEACVPDQKVAIIIPFRAREIQLKIFLRYIHRFLQDQLLHYTIYIIDQESGSAFNRAMLLNIGFMEALHDDKFTCFVFHDVDHIPVDGLLSYRCTSMPMHMAAMIDKWEWGIPYGSFVGGVTMQSTQHMIKMNGFSNNFWGWGGEDDDMLQRWAYTGMHYVRPSGGHGRYATIKANHSRSSAPNPERMELLKQSRARMPYDGLNTLHYRVMQRENHPLYTRIRVFIKRIGLR